MELYIVRHGQTDWNKEKKMQGRADMPLNEEGRAQAERVGRALKNINFDAVFASPLQRALDTASIIAGHNDIIVDERIYEIALGKLEGLVYRNLEKAGGELYETVQAFFMSPDKYIPTEGGESYQNLLARTGEFLENLPKSHPDQKILLVSHATSIHAMLAYIKKTPLKDLWLVPIVNGSVTRAVYGEEGYIILDEGLVLD
ncbi:histidine phosphatase family protein [Parasporobacterium paucivorans]|uniref:Probable phosphoglycerate mutase n=1 Tax=Parasporobacterium paucivorans DSM 15970 TaxID=1122934 RepID=A0A1M6DLZ1_9FIRM|nr:histidine phosphatase family protein [Parasporobacterium paucivorans]SHI74151.1 probable phosphoglycerate mutase [Parasporobacterium paucivorans DSM 15970]